MFEKSDVDFKIMKMLHALMFRFNANNKSIFLKTNLKTVC